MEHFSIDAPLLTPSSGYLLLNLPFDEFGEA